LPDGIVLIIWLGTKFCYYNHKSSNFSIFVHW